MKTKILNSKDFYAGLLFVSLGLVAVLVAASSYPIGTAVHMGPGFFPIILGGILILLGLVIAARVLWVSGQAIEPISLRPVFLVLGAMMMFTFLVEPLGLLLALLTLIFLSALGGWEFRIREVIILYMALALLAVAIFVYGLGIPFSLLPR